MGGETCVHHFESRFKQKLMEWCHVTSSRIPKEEDTQECTMSLKIVITEFWGEMYHSYELLASGTELNSDSCCIEMPRNLIVHVCLVYLTRRVKCCSYVTMLRHKHVRTDEAVTHFGWTVLQHPLYSLDLTSSKYYLFGSLKESLQGRHYAEGKALQNAVPMASGATATVTRWKYLCLFEGG
jgi:hypothetical protein